MNIVQNKRVAMLVVIVKAQLEMLIKWVAGVALGSLARVTDLSVDADMALLLRVELPRSRHTQ